jgi:hypothetical protein
LTYFRDGDLSSLPKETQEFLAAETRAVQEVIKVDRISERISAE